MSMPLPKLTAVHYLFTRKREDRWLAHCLDFDIVTGGATEDDAEDRLDRLVQKYIEDALRFQGGHAMLSTAAPREFWKRYHEAFTAGRTRPPRRTLTIRVPVPEVVLMDERPQPSGEIEVLSVDAAAA